jgi:hypothetical protein
MVNGIFTTSMHLPIQENSSCIQVLYPNEDTLADLMVKSRVTPHTTHFLQVSFNYTQLKIIKYMIKDLPNTEKFMYLWMNVGSY